MWRAAGCGGGPIRTGSIRGAWCSSTRPGPRPTWPRCAAGACGAGASSPRCRMVTGRHDLHGALRCDRIEAPGSSTARSTARASGLCRADSGPDAGARRHRRHGQPRLAQRPRRARGDPRGWGAPLAAPAVLPGPQPDRAGVRQAQGAAAQGQRTHPRGHLAQDRRPARRTSPRPSVQTTSPNAGYSFHLT